MKKVRGWPFLLLAAALLAASTAGAQEVVLRHLGYVWHGDPWHQYIEARIEEFQALHPNVKIERLLAGQGDSIEDKFTVMVAGGIPPDVVEMTLSQGGGMAPKGVFKDLRPFFERDPDVSLADFAPTAVNALTWSDGTLWGFPMDVFPVASYYNIDLFNEAGLRTPAEMEPREWNWDYALEAAQKLTRDRNGDGVTDQWGIDGAWALVNYAIPMKQAGGGFYDRDVDPQQSRLLDERTLEAFEWVATIYRQEVNAKDYEIGFDQGRTGFNLVNGPTGIKTLSQVATFAWNVGPPLHGPDNNGGYVAVNSLQISSYTEHADLAWEWVKFLAADAGHLEDFVRRTTRIPSYLPVLPSYPELIGDAPSGVTHFVDVIVHPKSFHPAVGPTTRQTHSLILGGFLDRVATGQAAVRQTLEVLHSQIQALLSSSN